MQKPMYDLGTHTDVILHKHEAAAENCKNLSIAS